MKGFKSNIEKDTLKNENFRKLIQPNQMLKNTMLNLMEKQQSKSNCNQRSAMTSTTEIQIENNEKITG